MYIIEFLELRITHRSLDYALATTHSSVSADHDIITAPVD